jgi:hypothetical protein
MKCQIHIPGPLVTGGPENCHQIADGLNRLGIECRIQYYQTDAIDYRPITWLSDNPFMSKYRAAQRVPGDGYQPTHYIFGSVDHRVSHLFHDSPRALHWNVTPNVCRKVPGLRRAVELLVGRRPRLWSKALQWIEDLNEKGFLQERARWVNRPEHRNLLHAAQSLAAYCQLRESFHCDPVLLYDYCHQEFFDQVDASTTSAEGWDVVYQPRSEPHASLVLEGMGLKTRVLKGLTRAEVIRTLKSSKCYLDLGNHPGRDRLPREAVACGSVLVVGMAGTASYFADVPCLPDLRVPRGDIDRIRREILRVIEAPEAFRSRQRFFAEEIRRQRDDFDRQLLAFVTRFESLN